MRKTIRKLARDFGYDIIKFKKNEIGLYPFYDMGKFVKAELPILIDVGANTGQTVKDLTEVFSNSIIHSFEPSAETFKILTKKTKSIRNLHLWNFGVGSEKGYLHLNEYNLSNTNSFLARNELDNSKIIRKSKVAMISIDDFCIEQNIKKIDVLKIDTEGFELEVLNGALKSFDKNKIGLLYFEVSFTKSHKGMATFPQLWDFAVNKGFELISIYPIVYRKGKASYTNILFKHHSY